MKSAFVVLLGVVFISMGCNKSNPGVANADDAKEVADNTDKDQKGADDYFPGGGGLQESEAPVSFQDDELNTEDEMEDDEQGEYAEYKDDEDDEDDEDDKDDEDDEDDEDEEEYSPF